MQVGAGDEEGLLHVVVGEGEGVQEVARFLGVGGELIVVEDYLGFGGEGTHLVGRRLKLGTEKGREEVGNRG